MKEEPGDTRADIIKLPTSKEERDPLVRNALEFKRIEIAEMHERMERGELSEKEKMLIQAEAARKAQGQRGENLTNLYDIQPAVKEAIKRMWTVEKANPETE